MKKLIIPKSINIFINYRRNDSAGYSGRIYDALKNHFEIFYDTDSIKLGEEFPKRLKEGIQKADIILSIIGKDCCQEFKKRWDTEDYVLQEIAYAHELNKCIFPILIDNASIPVRECIPTAISFLLDLNTYNIAHEKFHQDIEFLKFSIHKECDIGHMGTIILPSASMPIFDVLESYLKKSQWEESNCETINLFLKFSKREKDKWLRAKDIDALSYDFLLPINGLWQKYSGGNFGFSKQLALIKEYDLSLDNPNDFIKFSNSVQWKKNGKWEYKGNMEVIGSYPTPICFKSTLACNRSTFQNILKRIEQYQKEYYGKS